MRSPWPPMLDTRRRWLPMVCVCFMLMTAAGCRAGARPGDAPGRGLAIATARRLGGWSWYDIRAVVKEQIEPGRALAVPDVGAPGARGLGGWRQSHGRDWRQREALAAPRGTKRGDHDPRRYLAKAPVLITAEMAARMVDR